MYHYSVKSFNFVNLTSLIFSYIYQRIGLFYFSESRIRRFLNELELYFLLNVFWIFDIICEKYSKFHFELSIVSKLESTFILVHHFNNRSQVICSLTSSERKNFKVKNLRGFQLLDTLTPNNPTNFEIPLSNLYYLNDFVIELEENYTITIKPKISSRNIFMATIVSIFQHNSDDIQFFFRLIKFFRKRFAKKLSYLNFLPNWLKMKLNFYSNSNSNNVSLGIEHTDPPSNVFVDSYGLMFNDENFFIKDLSNSPENGFTAGNHRRVFYNYYQNRISFLENFDTNNVLQIERGVYLSGKYDANWFHFIIETLPRLLLLPDKLDRSDLPLIVSSLVPQQGLDLLELFWKGEIIVNHNLTKISNLIVPPHHTILLDDTRSPSLRFECDFNSDVLIEYRNFIHQTFDISSNRNLSLKLCLMKKNGNRWLNIEDYCRRNHGSEVIKAYPESLSLYDQIQLYKECSHLIGEGGVLSNMLFLPKGSNVITGIKSSQLTRTWFSSLAEIFELNYFEIPEKILYENGHSGERLSTYLT